MALLAGRQASAIHPRPHLDPCRPSRGSNAEGKTSANGKTAPNLATLDQSRGRKLRPTEGGSVQARLGVPLTDSLDLVRFGFPSDRLKKLQGLEVGGGLSKPLLAPRPDEQGSQNEHTDGRAFFCAERYPTLS